MTVSVIRVSPICMACVVAASVASAQQPSGDVPVTIKELDVEDAIVEFVAFQERLGRFRDDISQGREVANETAQILEDLRASATADNGYNEAPILAGIESYVSGVLQKQVELVDFLDSQRYRISYYANKMASSIRPKQLALLFGTEAQNDAAITARVREVEQSKQQIAAFVDDLPPEYFDRKLFRPQRSMPASTRRSLDLLLYRYQEQRNRLAFAKRRLGIVRASQRAGGESPGITGEIDADLLIGQMFGVLDRIRLQMSLDLVSLERMLAGYSRSSRTKEILSAFQNLVQLQGSIEGPSTELASVLDWLQDSSTQRLELSANELAKPGLRIPRYSELLREAYEGARGSDN